MVRALFLGFAILQLQWCAAQLKDIEKVKKADFLLKKVDWDTTANAIILFDIGRFDGNTLWFTRNLRVKILNKAGLGWGNWVFNTPTKSNFKVTVYNLVGQEIEKESMPESSVFKEQVVNSFEVYKVFAPNVREGSIIDIQYSFLGLPSEWRFQERIPIVYNELTLEPSERVNYNKTHFGFVPIETISDVSWRAQNVPAFQEEPFLNSFTNYLTKFKIQVVSFGAGRFFFDLSSTWKKIIENLLLFDDFGGKLKSLTFLDEKAEELKALNAPLETKVARGFQYIKDHISWDGTKALFARESIKKSFEIDHSGNSAEINLALVYLLNKAGVTTYPMVLSTRDNGMLVEFSPSLTQLNYVIGYVDHEGTNMFLDATSTFSIPGILPDYCLNGRGLLVKKDNEQWFTLNTKFRAVKSQFINVSISDNRQVTAKINQDMMEYTFLDWMESLKQADENEELLKSELQKKHSNLSVLDYKIISKDPAKMVGKEMIHVDLSDAVASGQNEIFINPFVLFDFESNILKGETRRYPLDLTYPRESRTTLIMDIPSTLNVVKYPSSTRFSTPDDGANFMFLCEYSQSKITAKVILKLNKYVFVEEEYQELRQFFSEVIKAMGAPIQLASK